MIIREAAGVRPSEITDQRAFVNRREFIKAASAMAAVSSVGLLVSSRDAHAGQRLEGYRRSAEPIGDKLTPYKDVTAYNNFYELGTDKSDPARNAAQLITQHWTVAVEGEINKPKIYDIDDLLKMAPLEERTYRMRCVEGWSMVVPWIGYPLNELIRRSEPTGNAKYVEFTTLYDPGRLFGQRRPILKWPYIEGLRLDEAKHPLTLVCLGLYGEILPNQNGAPVRIVVPWKYGFKSAKSLVKIRFVEQQPLTTWNRAAPSEYGFYSNVNPDVDHPRWSQGSERRIGDHWLFSRKRETLMFNGYAEQVSPLYSGMNLRKFF